MKFDEINCLENLIPQFLFMFEIFSKFIDIINHWLILGQIIKKKKKNSSSQ